ncbi:hypothetical protein BMS3Bbin01_01484 [bacterium BMS3Bbin01]|nr:hypothetical protein BMS3Bbin01_01484 [bacterium BMS3Bbin01]
MWVRGDSPATDLEPEVVELVFGQAAFEEGTSIDARRGVTLDENLVAGGSIVLPAEEMVEADLVEGGRRGERGQVPSDSLRCMVGTHDHDGGVPADEPADSLFESVVSGEPRLFLGRDRIDVGRVDRGRDPHLLLPGAQQHARQQIPCPGLALDGDELVERVEPFLGLGGVGVGELLHEAVDIHEGLSGRSMQRVSKHEA